MSIFPTVVCLNQINNQGGVREDEESSGKWPRWVTIVSVIGFVAVAVVATYFITKGASKSDSYGEFSVCIFSHGYFHPLSTRKKLIKLRSPP
jgi:hypothetical protein